MVDGVKLIHGAPHTSEHQSPVERTNRTIEDSGRTSRMQAGAGPEFWEYSQQHARSVRVVIPTKKEMTNFKPSGKNTRPLTPQEKWEGKTAPSFADLHKNLYPFMCQAVGFIPVTARKSKKNDDHGVLGLILCSAYPDMGDLMLILKSGKVRAFRTTIKHENTFPLLDELRRSVPKGITLAPSTLEMLEAPALLSDRTKHITGTNNDEQPGDQLTIELMPKFEPIDYDNDTVSSPVEKESKTNVPTEEQKPSKSKRKGKKVRLKDEESKPSSIKSKFSIGDKVMTVEGPAIVFRVNGDSIPADSINLSWPKHHSNPSTVYTVRCADVWFQHERPGEAYDSYGKRVHETNAMEMARVYTEMIDPNEVVGIVLADEIILPKYSRKQESPYAEMMTDSEDKEWTTLFAKEMFSDPVTIDSLSEEDRKTILRLQWVYKAKCDQDGLLALIKARLVADGSREKGKLPAGEIYTPVMVMTTVRIMLAVCLQHPGVRFHQLDIDAAYATAIATRTIHVHYPPGRYPKGGHGSQKKCLRLLRSLYGVVDSGRNFYEEWIDYHIALGFQTIHADKCYMIFWVNEDQFIRFCFHVDDNIIAQIGEDLWQWYLSVLHLKYTYKVGPLKYCMGIEFDIDYKVGSIKMTQAAQTERMLRELELTKLTPARCPVSSNVQPSLDMIENNPSKAVQAFPMKKFLGHFNYLQQGTKPDITRALKIASKFGLKFGEVHTLWVKRIARYLAGTKSCGITFRRVAKGLQNLLQIFTDASHASDPDTRRSISGVVIKLGGNTVLWKANFQKIVSHSSTESELMSLDVGATLSQYVKWITWAMGVTPQMPIPICVDNSSTIHITTNPIQPGRNVHIHARYYYVRDLVQDHECVILKIDTKDQISDVLVTFKDFPTFHRFRQLLLNCAYVAIEDGVLEWVGTYMV